MSKLKKTEIDKLLKQAYNAVKEERSLSAVFEDFAKKTGRAKGGVRNLYYALLKEGKTNEELVKKYPQLKTLKAEKNTSFTQDEQEELFSKVQAGIKRGKSVRKTIRDLSMGDEKLALRYQNKYRNMLKQRGALPKFDKDERYERLKDAVDKLLDRMLKTERMKKSELERENAQLKERLKAAEERLSESRLKVFFADKGGNDVNDKHEKVDE